MLKDRTLFEVALEVIFIINLDMSAVSSVRDVSETKEIRMHGEAIQDSKLVKLFNPIKLKASNKEVN